MRIAIATSRDPFRQHGGGETYVAGLCRALADAGHSVTVADRPDAIRRGDADLVHAHGNKLQAARRAREEGLPCVVTMHHGGLVCPQGALLDRFDRVCRRPVERAECTDCCLRGRWWGNVPPAVGRFLRRLPNIPFITPAMTVGAAVEDKLGEIAELRRTVSMFVAPSASARDALLRNGIPEPRVALVPHGVTAFARRPPPLSDPIRFCYAGRIVREKGLHVLVEAISRLHGNCELHILGRTHSKWAGRYLRRIRIAGPIVLHGHLAGSALEEQWARCHVTVLPSICMETFGLVVQESFSLGRPVIVTDCGGPPEQVRHGTDGFVVPPNDPAALAAAMQRFVDDPGVLADATSRLPPPRTMAEHVAGLEQVYLRCLRNDGSTESATDAPIGMAGHDGLLSCDRGKAPAA